MRKGHFFLPVVTIIVIVALVTAWVLLAHKYDSAKNLSSALGTKQSTLIAAYNIGREAQVYLDLATPYALQYAIQIMAENGGIISDTEGPSPCGNYMYNVWNGNGNDCSPDVNLTLALAFNQQAYPFFNAHPFLNSLLDPFQALHLQQLTPLVFSNYSQEQYRIYAETVTPLKIPIGQGAYFVNIASSGLPPSKDVYTDCPNVDQLVSLTSLGLHCKSANCKLRSEAAQRLKETNERLMTVGINGRSYQLYITDSFRTYDEQLALWYRYCPSRDKVACRNVVSYPDCGSAHMAGGAVDIKLMDLSGNVLSETGCSGAGGCAYSQHHFTDSERALQAALEQFMCEDNWVRFHNEWWHFEYGTKRWKDGQDRGVCNT
jgi:D-alanyl-D-alanine dipeptidase